MEGAWSFFHSFRKTFVSFFPQILILVGKIIGLSHPCNPRIYPRYYTIGFFSIKTQEEGYYHHRESNLTSCENDHKFVPTSAIIHGS